ncbi:hypothetical protein N0V88_006591 [Collariella sp. IMI 366227]|nr:hypothetical protein N0V88_006591 [Collariella sp. IMI 366227]
MLTQGNQLFTCPAIKKMAPKRVFDAGCGTGIWALEFGDMYPESSVVGLDISPIQPHMVAPNVEFFIGDLEETWNFVHPFDFVYARMLTGSIKDWPKFFAQSFEQLNPGGRVEACDIVCPLLCDDGTLPENCPLKEWDRLCLEATIKLGAPFDSARHYEQQMKDAGFQNVTVVKHKWPINTWPKDPKHKELGWWGYHNMMAGISALAMMSFTQVLGWSTTEVEVFLAGVRKDTKNRDIHAYWPM